VGVLQRKAGCVARARSARGGGWGKRRVGGAVCGARVYGALGPARWEARNACLSCPHHVEVWHSNPRYGKGWGNGMAQGRQVCAQRACAACRAWEGVQSLKPPAGVGRRQCCQPWQATMAGTKKTTSGTTERNGVERDPERLSRKLAEWHMPHRCGGMRVRV